jgi:hypothetical protein
VTGQYPIQKVHRDLYGIYALSYSETEKTHSLLTLKEMKVFQRGTKLSCTTKLATFIFKNGSMKSCKEWRLIPLILKLRRYLKVNG